jgi:hypothetical protein
MTTPSTQKNKAKQSIAPSRIAPTNNIAALGAGAMILDPIKQRIVRTVNVTMNAVNIVISYCLPLFLYQNFSLTWSQTYSLTKVYKLKGRKIHQKVSF